LNSYGVTEELPPRDDLLKNFLGKNTQSLNLLRSCFFYLRWRNIFFLEYWAYRDSTAPGDEKKLPSLKLAA